MKKLREWNSAKSRFMAMVAMMGPKRHWPDREKPFNYRESEVCGWLLEQDLTWEWIFQRATESGAIVFDPGEKVWVGAGTARGQELALKKAEGLSS